MEGQGRHPFIGQSGEEFKDRGPGPGSEGRPGLDRHGRSHRPHQGPDQAQKQRGVLQEGCAVAAVHHLAGRAAQVEINEVRAQVHGHPGGLGQVVGIFAEELDAEWFFQLKVGGEQGQGGPAPMGQAGGADHFRDRETGAGFFGQEAEGPVAESGQRRQKEGVIQDDRTYGRPGCGHLNQSTWSVLRFSGGVLKRMRLLPKEAQPDSIRSRAEAWATRLCGRLSRVAWPGAWGP